MNNKAEQILDCAKELFLSKGYRATSIQSIADAAGIAKGSVYRHFKNKESLLLALLGRIDDEIFQKIDIIDCDKSLNPREKFVAQLKTEFDLTSENKQLNDMFFKDALDFTPELFEFLTRMRLKWQQMQQKAALEYFGDKIKPWQSDISVVMNGMINEYSSYWILEDVQLPIEEVVEFIVYSVEQIVEGLEKSQPKPALKENIIPGIDEINEIVQERKIERLKDAMTEFVEIFESLNVAKVDRKMIADTIDMLGENVLIEPPNTALINALLAGLRERKEFNYVREKIAKEFGLELI